MNDRAPPPDDKKTFRDQLAHITRTTLIDFFDSFKQGTDNNKDLTADQLKQELFLMLE